MSLADDKFLSETAFGPLLPLKVLIESDPLTALKLTVQSEHYIRSCRAGAVAAARQKGASWEAIDKALGVSRQAAHRQYSYLLNKPTRSP